jgi:hypothetical protein
MKMKKFYGIMGNATDFLKGLTLVESSNYGWTEKYLDHTSGNYWLKYMVDRDTGRYFNLMFISPKPTTQEILNIAFTSEDFSEVEGASHRLLIEEEDEKKNFRSELVKKLKSIDVSKLSELDKKRLKNIIINTHLTDKMNRREIVGKSINEVKTDSDYFLEISEYAQILLSQLK